MWTLENRAKYNRDHLRYPSDLTDDEWAHVEPLIPPAKPGGGKRRTDMRHGWGDVYPEYRLPMALSAEGLSVVQHGAPLFCLVAMRWCARSHSSRAIRRMPRKGGTRGLAHRRDHR